MQPLEEALVLTKWEDVPTLSNIFGQPLHWLAIFKYHTREQSLCECCHLMCDKLCGAMLQSIDYLVESGEIGWLKQPKR